MTTFELDKSFDRIAGLYDQVRPSYPTSVYERILAYSGVDSSARLLEVGTGTGKGTLPLARRGLNILGLEPGANLAQIARERLAEFPNTRVQTVSFEDWEGPAAGFDLAFVAQAFHWLAPDQRLSKLAHLLRPSGTLAIFGHAGGLAAGALKDAILGVYQRHSAGLDARGLARGLYGSADGPISVELRGSALFTELHAESTTWERSCSAGEYCSLLSSYSDHSTLPPEELRELLTGVARAIDQHGGTASVVYTTTLFLVRKA